MGQQDADEHRHDDHDDQRRPARAEDPVYLHFFDVQHGKERYEHGEQRSGGGARDLASATTLGRLRWLLRMGRRGHCS